MAMIASSTRYSLVRLIRRYSSLSSPVKEVKLNILGGNDVGIAVVSMNRPKVKNAVGRIFLDNFKESMAELHLLKDVRVMVLRSEVRGVFCAGADLKERAKMNKEEVKLWLSEMRRFAYDLGQLDVPTIAAIDGVCLGGGLEISLWCDMRVASSDARLGLTETKLAIIPAGGGTQNLPRLIGCSKAKELIYTGRIVDGREAFALGMVNRVEDQNDDSDAAYQGALSLAREISQNGPVALRMAKRAINEGLNQTLAEGYDTEMKCYSKVIPTKDRLEGLLAFKEKRKPLFTGE